jgi:hypothetical protein
MFGLYRREAKCFPSSSRRLVIRGGRDRRL